jgi:2-polyprenyl-3-methyl-5-hydroxy-6-metoxy-1,4-benzoquinol methylase
VEDMPIIKIYVSSTFPDIRLMAESLSKLKSSSVGAVHVEFVNLQSASLEGDIRSILRLLLKSQMILVNANSCLTYQAGLEMAIAKIWKIPIYLIGDNTFCSLAEDISEDYRLANELSEQTFPDLMVFQEYLVNSFQNHHSRKLRSMEDIEDKIAELMSFDGGYDEGYSLVSNFWGTQPAALVVKCAELLKNTMPKKEICCLDLGCGTGKNSIYLNSQGFKVDAVDVSYFAIKEAKTMCKNVNWMVCDIRKISSPNNAYDAVIMTGSLHCLASADEIRQVVSNAQAVTTQYGYHVLSAFNSGLQDLSGHAQSFSPTLLTHEEYVDMYKGWNIISSSNLVQEDIHPHNRIPHSHSITRILAQKL